MERRRFSKTNAAIACLFVIALLVRGIYLYESASNPTFFAPVVDSETYDRLASAFAAGEDLTDEFFWQPPFYPLFLGVVYRVTGSSIVWAKILQALIGAATTVLTFFLGRRLFDVRVGVLAGLGVALYGPLLFFDAELLATGWAAFWSVALILLLLRAGRSDRLWPFLALGSAGALAAMTRPTFLPFLVAAGGWLALTLHRRIDARATAGRLLLVLAGFLAICLPVARESHQARGSWSLLPASGGLNFYVGNNPQAERTIAIRPGWDWEQLTRRPERFGVRNKRDTGRFFFGEALRYARADPLGLLRGWITKAGHFLSSRELPRNVDMYVFRDGSAVLRTLVWKAGGFGFPFGVLLPLTGVGLVLATRKLPGPVLLFLLLVPASVILVFVSARYRAPVVPVLSVVAAGGLIDLLNRIRDRRWRDVSLAGGAALLLLLLTTLPGPFPQERADYRAELDYSVGTRALNAEDLETAVEHLRRSVDRQPDHFDARNHLGIAYAKLGRLALATECFERAVRDNPEFLTARINYGRLLAAQGRMREAASQFRLGLEQEPDNAELQERLRNATARQ